MKGRLLIYTLLGASALNAFAQSEKMDAYSYAIYNSIKGSQTAQLSDMSLNSISSFDAGGERRLDAFVTVEDSSVLDELRNLGVDVNVTIGQNSTISVPESKLDALLSLDGVTYLEFARECTVSNDLARIATGQADVIAGTGLSKGYDGTGVIYGTFDSGIDFNHIAFKKSDGTSRILYAYLPSQTAETKVEGAVQMKGKVYSYTGEFVDGTFPGYVYSTEYIKNLTTDTEGFSHGSHTLGTGAGYWEGNDYYGMAPKSDIIACASSDLSNANIVNSTALVFQKAKELEKPAVVNLSLGSTLGPHDGSEVYITMLDQLSTNGSIVVLSAGNDGASRVYLNKPASTESVTSLFYDLRRKTTSILSPSVSFDIWSRDGKAFQVQLIVYDKSTESIVYSFPVHSASASGGSSRIYQNTSYFTGNVTLFSSYSSRNNKCEIYGIISSSGLEMTNNNYMLGIKIIGSGTNVDAWTKQQSLTFYNGENNAFENGSPNCSVSNLACGKNTISVGSYNSRYDWLCTDGLRYHYTSISESDVEGISYFSSYGVDMNGVSRPDVLAPGSAIISAVSSYDSQYSKTGAMSAFVVANETVDGREQRYAANQGTSMAAPCVSGIIATWLQADPTLDVEKIREVLKQTCVNDEYTKAAPQKSGSGKIDALAGLKYILNASSVKGAQRDEANPLIECNNGIVTVQIPYNAGIAKVNVFDMAGTLVASKSIEGDGSYTLDFSDSLSNGMYVVNVTANALSSATRMSLCK